MTQPLTPPHVDLPNEQRAVLRRSRKAFLQNTLEQAFITSVATLALATVGGEAALAYIVATVVLFSLGRATFLRGYPHGAGSRAFGIATTALPALGAYGWALVDMASDAATLAAA